MVSNQLIRISSYAKNKLQMCWVTQHLLEVAKCGRFHKLIQSTHFCLLQKNVWNNPFMIIFQHICCCSREHPNVLITMNRLFSLDKSFFVTAKFECSVWFHIWRLLHWWLSDATHLLFVLSIRGHPDELKYYHEWIVQSRQDIFCKRQKWVLWINLWKSSTFGDFYADVEWLNTSVVCS